MPGFQPDDFKLYNVIHRWFRENSGQNCEFTEWYFEKWFCLKIRCSFGMEFFWHPESWDFWVFFSDFLISWTVIFFCEMPYKSHKKASSAKNDRNRIPLPWNEFNRGVYINYWDIPRDSIIEIGSDFPACCRPLVVTINYRLGLLGTASFGTDGNWCLTDVLAGLKWVQENIEKFGGDPSCVTLMGYSGTGFEIMSWLRETGKSA